MGLEEVIMQGFGIQGAEFEDIKFDEDALGVTIYGTWPFHLSRCQVCDDFLLKVHSWSTRDIRAPGWGPYQRVTIKLRYCRGFCRSCFKIRTARVLFVHPEFESMTCGLFELAGRMMEEHTCAATARLLHLDEKTLWRLDQWRMEKMHGQMRLPEYLDVKKLSADEVHFRTFSVEERDHPFSPKWDVKFVTNLVCTKEAKVIANAAGRSAQALATCLKVLSKPQRLSVDFFALDMNQGYFRAVTRLCPNAEIAVDRFHLVQQLNKRFDQVRRDEFYKAKNAMMTFKRHFSRRKAAHC